MISLFLTLLSILAACGSPHADPSGVRVLSVQGLHAGVCPPKRATQIAAAVASLPSADFSYKNRCHCLYISYASIVKTIRSEEQYAPAARDENVIIVQFARPVVLPIPSGMKTFSGPVTMLIARVSPGTQQTTLIIRHSSEPTSPLPYDGYIFEGDPFGMNHPHSECG